MEIKEGYMPFMGYQTYYRIVGKTEEGKSPIILLHGGPGSTHNYFELLDRVAETGRAVIMYDQLGCGNSFVEGHPERARLIENAGGQRIGFDAAEVQDGVREHDVQRREKKQDHLRPRVERVLSEHRLHSHACPPGPSITHNP